jgi:hypothetical protein
MTEIRRLTRVYNARGTLAGELAYMLGKLSGRARENQLPLDVVGSDE